MPVGILREPFGVSAEYQKGKGVLLRSAAQNTELPSGSGAPTTLLLNQWRPSLGDVFLEILQSGEGISHFRTCHVLVEDLPNELKDVVSRTSIEGWVRNRLENVGISVSSNELRDEKLAESLTAKRDGDEVTYLKAYDESRSMMYVRISGFSTSCYASIEIYRPGLVYPGRMVNGSVKEYGTSMEGKISSERIRSSLNSMLDKFEIEWSKLNTRIEEDEEKPH